MTLDEQYQKTIDEQRAYLLKLQDEFNKACDVAKEKAQKRLKEIPADNKEARAAVLNEQKSELNEALSKLRQAVDESTRATMKKLEEIVRQKETKILEELEQQLAAL